MIEAPVMSSRRHTDTLGESRRSLVPALKARPHTAMRLPAHPPSRCWASRLTTRSNCRSLLATVLSSCANGSPSCRATCASARVSFGRHEPPQPGPAARNFGPILGSIPRTRIISCTSAPAASQIFAIALTKLSRVARKAFAACFVSSAVGMSVTITGASNTP